MFFSNFFSSKARIYEELVDKCISENKKETAFVVLSFLIKDYPLEKSYRSQYASLANELGKSEKIIERICKEKDTKTERIVLDFKS